MSITNYRIEIHDTVDEIYTNTTHETTGPRRCRDIGGK